MWLTNTYLSLKGTVFSVSPDPWSHRERGRGQTGRVCIDFFFVCLFVLKLLADELMVPIYKVALRIGADGQASPTLFFLI